MRGSSVKARRYSSRARRGLSSGPSQRRAEAHQRARPLGALQHVDRAAERGRRLLRVAELLVHGGEAEERGGVVGVRGAGLLEGRQRLRRIGEPAQPEVAELGREAGALVGLHRQRALDLRHLEREVPGVAPGVDAAELGQGRPEGRVEAQRLLVAGHRLVDALAALLQHLREAEQQARPQRAVLAGVELRRREALRIELDERRPATRHEVRFLEGLEGDAVARIRGEARCELVHAGGGHGSPLQGRTHVAPSHRDNRRLGGRP